MKNIFLPIFTAVILSSCGGVELSEKELINGFTKVKAQFEVIFNNPADHKQEDLLPLNDSMALYVNALISNYPKAIQLPEVLCDAGVSSLNSRDEIRSLKYLTYLVDSFPEHVLVPKSMYFIGRTKEVLSEDAEGAKVAYKLLYRSFPNTNWAEIAKSSIRQISNPVILESTDDEDSIDADTTEKN
jgi:hypothetical protein|tara:strand:+ start:307 stop:864 length:558 start_codon:yes stop_codon:yes gene_type:complete